MKKGLFSLFLMLVSSFTFANNKTNFSKHLDNYCTVTITISGMTISATASTCEEAEAIIVGGIFENIFFKFLK